MVWLVYSVHYWEQSRALSLGLESFLLLNTFLSLSKKWFRNLPTLLGQTIRREIILAQTCFWTHFPRTVNLFGWPNDFNNNFLPFLQGFDRLGWMVREHGQPLFRFEVGNRLIRLYLSLIAICLFLLLKFGTCWFFSTSGNVLLLCLHSTFL